MALDFSAKPNTFGPDLLEWIHAGCTDQPSPYGLPHPCRIWQGATHNEGYGSLWWDGRPQRLTRIVAALVEGLPALSDLSGLHVLHRCDQPACVEPSHLFRGTDRDNIRDCWAKGRQGKRGGNDGEKNPASKLTDQDVRTIRREYALGGWSHSELADIFDVTTSNVTMIIARQTWRHLED